MLTMPKLLAFCTCIGLFSLQARAVDTRDTGFALADLVRHAISLATIQKDPFFRSDLTTPHIAHDLSNLCTADNLEEGLAGNGCILLSVRECGLMCIDVYVDEVVYQRAKKQIEAHLEDPCTTLRELKRPARQYDSHPKTFFVSYRTSLAYLGCHTTPIQVLDSSYQANKLRITYRAG